MVRNLSLSRRRLGGSGGTKVRYVACCFFVTFLFLLSIYKARSIYGGKVYQKTQRMVGEREHSIQMRGASPKQVSSVKHSSWTSF